MARLFRFVKINDANKTQNLSFLLPQTLISDNPKEVESKDFFCCHQKWSVLVTKHDKQIGVFLNLKGVTDGLQTTVDFSFTFVNRQHFSKNETYSEMGCKFTSAKPRHGRRSVITMAELIRQDFAMPDGQYLLQLEMKNAKHVFEQVICVVTMREDRKFFMSFRALLVASSVVARLIAANCLRRAATPLQNRSLSHPIDCFVLINQHFRADEHAEQVNHSVTISFVY